MPGKPAVELANRDAGLLGLEVQSGEEACDSGVAIGTDDGGEVGPLDGSVDADLGGDPASGLRE
ncbi:hypothetical protein B7R25_08820 [Subtercola boreus]|uniref:Uncharacterized protein n=1 Tax=Subtercola boreus TaxID=120213 RepID=A0A3E0WD15_9MICO|nr:hypothetical protein B7R24_08755 [Subtercola boreus]RFA27148.1 hypothetical protein B7R25_08820 [Subtercola boreus]